MCTGMTSFNQPDGWISVKDQLPNTPNQVMIYDVERGISTGFYCVQINEWFSYEFDEPVVTHWQPLPEPPIMEKCAK